MGKNNYTVYMLKNKVNNKKYIGITSRNVNKRWDRGRGYIGQVIGDAIQKYGWDNFERIIIKEKISQNEAFKIEQELIIAYKTQEKIFGYNRSAGGESGSFGAYNVQHNRMVKAYQYDTDGYFIKEYISIEEAKRQLGVKGGNISACCNGYRKIAHGYRWFHDFMGEKIDKLEDRTVRVSKARSKEIYQYSIQGKFIRKFKSISDAHKELGCSGIQACVSGQSNMSAGYMWFDSYMGEKIKPKKFKYIAVLQCEMNGDVIRSFNTIQEASRYLKISGYLVRKCIAENRILNNTILKNAI